MNAFTKAYQALRNRVADATQQWNWGQAAQPVDGHWFVQRANFWRDLYNPLQGLNIQRAVELMRYGEHGAYADLQWTYRFIEKRDPTLKAILERYDGGLLKLDWQIKTKPEKLWPKGATKAMAEVQETALREAYDRIDNIRDVLAQLILAEFRGYCHLEKWRDDSGNITHLEPVPQWFWCREGTMGTWTFNTMAVSGQRKGQEVNLDEFVIYEVPRPINEIALVYSILFSLSIKDWASFLETYGIPAIFITSPAGASQSPEKVKAFQDVVEKITRDMRGTLPAGADIKFAQPGERGQSPFKEFMDYLRESLVLAATGGKLTMLTESGSGTLAGGAHQSAWDEVMQSKGKQHSEVMQKLFDKPEVLDKLFPGQPALVYWELSTNGEVDSAAVVADVVGLSNAGYEVSAEQIAEKTGYDVTKKEPLDLGGGSPFVQGRFGKPEPEQGEDEEKVNGENGKPFGKAGPRPNGMVVKKPVPPGLSNRDVKKDLEAKAAEQYAAALMSDFAALRERGEALLSMTDEQASKAKARELLAELATFKADILKLPTAARVIAESQFAALANGIEQAAKARKVKV